MGIALPGWPARTLFAPTLRFEIARARNATLRRPPTVVDA
jgi:hypothetical protein